MTEQQQPFAAFVGVDWGDQEHAVCVSVGGQRITRTVAHKAEDLEAWAAELRQHFGGRCIAVCLEQSRGALIYALLKYDFLVLFPINPKQLASYREAFVPSGAKDDPTDAELAALFVEQHHARLRAWKPDDLTTRTLRLLVEDRRLWVDERTALKNRLRQRLKEFFPLALELTSDIDCDWFLRLLAKFPSQDELRRANPRTLARLFPKRRRVDADDGEDPRVAKVRAAQPLVTDRAVIAAHRLAVLQIVPLIIQLNKTVAEYDRQIAEQMAQHSDAALFESFPGAGPALAPRLAVAFGTDRDRFASAEDMQKFSGIAPVLKRSGKTCCIQRRRACPKFLRQTFHEFADHSRHRCAWARAYYRMLRARGRGHHAAIRSLAFKWQRVLFRCWKSRKSYDETQYMRQLMLRNSPLLACLEKTDHT
jgi:transposase